MENRKRIQKLVKKWQSTLKLDDWIFNIEFVDFQRTDYQQSGDIQVDLKSKIATILISNNPRYSHEQIIVHELTHLLFWEYDHFCENLISKRKTNQYFDLLERVVANFTSIFLSK